MKPGKLTLLVVALAMALPATASAATFTVNVAGAGSDAVSGGAANGVCDADPGEMGNQCTLREALKEANAKSNNDTIKFSSSVFQGVHEDDYIFLTGPLAVTREVTINGGNCAVSGTAKPCVGVDTNGHSGLLVTADDVDVRGLAVFGANGAADRYGISLEGDGDTVKGSWLGANLNGDFGFNSNGIVIQGTGDDAVIGGTTGADRNVFGYGEAGTNSWIRIIDADHNRIRGNYFGVRADGTSLTGTAGTGIVIESGGDEETDNVIGKTVSSSAAATTTCDGGCNVIVGASTGILDAGELTKVKGNFIGLDKTGTTALPNTSNGIDERGVGAVIGGNSSRDRNYIIGGVFGIFKFFGTEMSVKRNFIGLNSAGTEGVGSLSTGVVLGASSTAARNRIAGVVTGIHMDNDEGRAVRNKIGIGRNGEDLPGASNAGILALRDDGIIGEPGAGNTIGNSDVGVLVAAPNPTDGDRNKVQGNLIGVDSNGVERPNRVGIELRPTVTPEEPDDTVIGGNSGGSENVISNSDEDAIRITEAMGGSPQRNRIRRNRGKDNGDPMSTDCDGGPCDLFIDIGPDGFGNIAGPNDQIEAPEITNDEPGDATRSHLEGLARENATIYIFRTSAAADLSPNRINAFVKLVSVGGGNEWSANFSQIPAGQRLTALQIDENGNASELALAVDPTAPPP